MLTPIRRFLKLEAASGIVLMVVAVLAMLAANSPLGAHYAQWTQPLQAPIKNGLMVIFFFLIGLEIKRELAEGELSTRRKAALPLIGALGGVALPAVIYLALNHGTPLAHGWAIPCATDIAFALGVVALFGNRVHPALKIFLMALAVIDDLAAVIIIALFYSGGLSFPALLAVAACLLVLWYMARSPVEALLPYLLVGLVLWLAMLFSGVHATVAGVLLGLLMPRKLGDQCIHALHGWVAFGIMPLFAFANAGVALGNISLAQLAEPMPLGIIAGLFLGKQLGIFSFCWLAVKLRLAELPAGASWKQLYAVAVVAGIGFTMSLFIGALAFAGKEQDVMRMSVLAGSLLSALVGAALLWWSTRQRLSEA
jgi:NhaA family Na+:H+ antiporter